MTGRELVKLLMDNDLDRELYIGKGMGPLAYLKVSWQGAKPILILTPDPEQGAS
jgi:hypothetical protein